MAQVSEAVTYLYCVKLPGFSECYCESISKTSPYLHTLTQQQQETTVRHLRATLQGQGLIDECSYTMVKIGISTHPADRLCSIMRGLEEFGAKGPHFSQIRENDLPDDTVKKGQSEDNIIFIKKCSAIGSTERDIRKLIGIDCGQAFQDQFKATIGDDSYIDQVGMTEGVLMRNDLMKAIQHQYRQNWNLELFRRHYQATSSCPTGNVFFTQMDSFRSRVLKQRNIIPPLPYDIKIHFPPTRFSYTHVVHRT